MEDRKLSEKRLFGLIKSIVVVFSLFCIVLGVFILSGDKTREQLMVDNCNKSDNSQLGIDTCANFIQNVDDGSARGFGFTAIGLGTLIIFFGGVGMYKYIFPKS